MKLKIIFALLQLAFSYHSIFSQVLSVEENKLYNIIMEYRKEKRLPPIPLSISLTLVAQTHVKDLVSNKPDLGSCNTHSWSANGPWKACCYTSDHSQASLMWSKPRELTPYNGNGYEIACVSSEFLNGFNITAEEAMEEWRESSEHNNVIINQGIWKEKWNAIGIGILNGYAVVWFGNEIDNHKNH